MGAGLRTSTPGALDFLLYVNCLGEHHDSFFCTQNRIFLCKMGGINVRCAAQYRSLQLGKLTY